MRLLGRRPLELPARITLRRMTWGAGEAERGAIHTVMGNDSMSQQLEDMIHLQLQREGKEHLLLADPGEEDSPVGAGPAKQHPLLQWLWNHRQQILQFVLSIIALFSGGGAVPPVTPPVSTGGQEQGNTPVVSPPPHPPGKGS